MRLLLYAAAYVLHRQLRTQALRHIAVAGATVNGHHDTIQNRRAGRVVQEQNRPPSAKRMGRQTAAADIDRATVSADAGQNLQLVLSQSRLVCRELTRPSPTIMALHLMPRSIRRQRSARVAKSVIHTPASRACHQLN